MARFRIRSVIDATPEETFGLYLDGDRRSEWNPSAREIIEQSGPTNASGSSYVVDTRFGPFEVTLLRVEAPRLIEMTEGRVGGSKTHVLMGFRRLTDGRTRLTVESTFTPRGRFGRLTAGISAALGSVYSRYELRRFKAAAERTSSRREAT